MAQSSKAQKRERQRQNRAVKLEQQAAVEKRQKFWRSARGFIIILVPIAALFVFFALRGGGDDSSTDKSSTEKSQTTTSTAAADPGKFSAPPPLTIDPTKTYVATMDTSEGSFEITLDPQDAPNTVNSFVFLAKDGFYDGLTFHRIVKDFVAQGGDPNGDGTGGPGYSLPDEPPSGGYQQYSVAMANSGSGTTGSQFFIATTAAGAKQLGGPPYLYSALGKVTSGTETIDKLNALGSASGTPTKKVTIDKVTISES